MTQTNFSVNTGKTQYTGVLLVPRPREATLWDSMSDRIIRADMSKYKGGEYETIIIDNVLYDVICTEITTNKTVKFNLRIRR